jgi:hypothetical protein
VRPWFGYRWSPNVHDLIERWRRSGRSHLDVLTAVALTAVTFGILATSGLLAWPDGVVTSLSAFGLAALVGVRRRAPIPVAVAAGMLIAIPELTSEAHPYNNGALVVPGLVPSSSTPTRSARSARGHPP